LSLVRLVGLSSRSRRGKFLAERGCRPLIVSTLPQTLIQKAGGVYCWGAEGTQDVDSFDRRLHTALLGVFFFSFGVPAAGGGIDAFFGVGFFRGDLSLRHFPFRVICLFDTLPKLGSKKWAGSWASGGDTRRGFSILGKRARDG
jgi:hypothetical protein